ncbi:Putative UDP-glucose 4-epimerase GalE1 [Mycobacteroides abscessus subsp. massiliense]|nr:Putative UDP-glucose 4-epimerase GalE1 [Mycobacteroides abscessus subsp. massiliense]
MPSFAVAGIASFTKGTRYTELSSEQRDWLAYGRAIDNTRMKVELGYQPKWTTVGAFGDYVRGRGITPVIEPEWVRSLGDRAVALAQKISS